MNGVDNMPNEFSFAPITFFQCNKKQNLEASSQGVLDPQSAGIIDLKKFPQHVEMLAGLEGFSHLWVIFVFHQNPGTWKTKVLPPRADKKVGVFASRSPYRPCPIGMSAVRIERIEGSKIYVSGHDLVDQTPILDIKPYLSYADSFPEASLGWVQQALDFRVILQPKAQEQIVFLKSLGVTELESTIKQQLRFHPTDKQRKRVKPNNSSPNQFTFSYRTWRILFVIQENLVIVQEVISGYSSAELSSKEDPFNDKELHRQFLSFNSTC